jgi:hypothetical protein
VICQPIVDQAKWLGESKGFWVQTGALVISAAAAVWLIWASDKSQRRRATIQLVIHQKLDEKLQKAKDILFSLHKDNATNFARYLEDPTSPEYDAIFAVLNNYEFIASGIHEDALDGELFKRLQYSVLIKDWEALCPLVMELRNQVRRETLFQEFEALAVNWKKSPLKRLPIEQ